MEGTEKAYISYRGISAKTRKIYGSYATLDKDGSVLSVHYPYDTGEKIRRHPKKFVSAGNMKGGKLFGMQLFPPGSAKTITILEGEEDAMAVYDMMGDFPAVSVRSASQALEDCTEHYNYINSFEKIVLCLDGDEAGKKATKELAALFDYNKLYHVKFEGVKDPNQLLEQGQAKKFVSMWWNASKFMPDEIVSSFDAIDALIDKEEHKQGYPFPWSRLTEMTYGMHDGDLVLLTALEGLGKTEIIRAIEHHVLKTTDENIGIIHLEESKGRAIKGLVGYELRKAAHLPDSGVTNEEVKKVFRQLSKRDNRVHLYTHFGSDDPSIILSNVQFLAGPARCKFIFLDHISMVVSGLATDNERQVLDNISTRLKEIAKSTGCIIVFISHVNDEGQTRGSRNIAKVADTRISINRDPLASTQEERNTTSLILEKNRFGSSTGPAGKLFFDPKTFTLIEDETRPRLNDGLPEGF